MSSEKSVAACDTNPNTKFSMVKIASQYGIRADVLVAVVIDYMSQYEADPEWSSNAFGSIMIFTKWKSEVPHKFIDIKTTIINGEPRVVDIIFNEAVMEDIVEIIKSNK